MTPYSTHPAILAAILAIAQRILPLFVLAGLFLAFLLFANHAYADQEPVAVDAPGSIRGHVVNQLGEPLNYGYVLLYSYPFGSSSSAVRQTLADPSGNYTFSLLGPGIYRVGFSDASQVFARQFYSDSTQFSTAVDIPVIGQQIAGVDAELRPGGVISGVVRLENYSSPYRNISVSLFEQTSVGWNELWSTGVDVTSDNFSFRRNVSRSMRQKRAEFKPHTVNLDGWKATWNVWAALFPKSRSFFDSFTPSPAFPPHPVRRSITQSALE